MPPGTEGAKETRVDWTYWLIQAGRGFGKTRTGAETVAHWAKTFDLVNLIAATADDARDIMIEGESGILSISPPWWRPHYEPSKRRLVWPNGSRSHIFTADEPERLRGKQHQKLWADEMASWRYADAWDQAQFGLRLGSNPQAVVTTTPRPIEMVRKLRADPGTVVTRGSTYDNRTNLSAKFFETVIKRYEGTRLGRQELLGELLDDNPDALFTRGDIEKGRVLVVPQLDRIVIAVDPAATHSAKSDETGITATGRAGDEGYLLADRSLRGSPHEWATAAVRLFHELKADRIVAEINNGGEMVEHTIRTVDPNVPVTVVTATRGKAVRAEPIAGLYEQGRIHHVGGFPELEDQMTEWNPGDKNASSPDRMDSLVWGFTELFETGDIDGLLAHIRAEQQQTPRALPLPGKPIVTTEQGMHIRG